MTSILCCLKSCDVSYICQKLVYNFRKIELVVHLLLVIGTSWLFLPTQRSQTQHSQPFTLIFQLSFKLRQLDSLAALEKPGWTFSPEQVGWDPTSRNYLCWSVVRIFNEYRLKSEIKEAPHFRSNETDLSVFHEILM